MGCCARLQGIFPTQGSNSWEILWLLPNQNQILLATSLVLLTEGQNLMDLSLLHIQLKRGQTLWEKMEFSPWESPAGKRRLGRMGNGREIGGVVLRKIGQ